MTAADTLPFPGDETPHRASRPVEVGGLIRVWCDDAHGRRGYVDVDVEDILRLGCGCWEAWSTRPGEARPRSLYSIVQRCGLLHDDGGGAGVMDRQPQVLRYGPE